MSDRELFTARARALIEEYRDQAAEAAQRRKPLEGLFGLGGGVKDEPCHDRFVQNMTGLIEELQAQAPDSAEIRAFLEALYTEPGKEENSGSVYWMLLAIQKLTIPLVDALSPGDAAALAARYAEDYPRRVRLPVQNELLSLLREKGGSAAPRRSLFRRNG